MSDKKLFLLDAMALVYRAYYALIRSPRITSKGKNTNAQFGFTNTLVELLRKEKPSHLGVIWDVSGPTERHENFLDYKANRQAAPEDFEQAIPDIKRIIEGFNIPCFGIEGYEADDVIGTLAWQASDLGYDVYMVTPDKDYGQLVRDNVFMYKPGYKGGTFEVLGPKEICEKWNIKSVDQVIDILGLMGDAVDNIPGIPGVGEKTAAKLIAEYETLENILEHADQIKGALGEKIRNGKASAVMSKMLATIITNAPVTFDAQEYEVKEPNKDVLREIFTELEFRTLGARILGEELNIQSNENVSPPAASKQPDLFAESPETIVPSEFQTIETVDHEYTLLLTKEEIEQFVAHAMQQKEISIDTETTSIDACAAELVGMSFSWAPHTGYYIPFNEHTLSKEDKICLLKPLLDRRDVLWIGQNIKYDMVVLQKENIELQSPHFDTMIAHYSIAPDGKQGMDFLARKFLNYEPVPISNLIGPKGKNQLNMVDVPIEIVKEYAAEDVDVTFQLRQKLEGLLDENGARNLFEEVENPLVPVLAAMESEGVRIDTDFLKKYAAELETEIRAAEKNIHEAAGHSFNIGSPKQLGEVLFDGLKLDEKAKKTKTGQYATGEDVLQKLKTKHPIIQDILIFRELSKLKSTYADSLPTMVNKRTGRVHSSFAQAVVVSGRLSSNNPNLQNIPIRTDRGREIRRAFVPANDDYILLSADYSQIELRIMAALSGDESMIEDFKNGKDIHTATAAKVYGLKENEVDSTMRRNAKAVNFGLIYGQSAFGLSQNLNIARGEAAEIIEQYFREYNEVKNFMDSLKENARQKGFVETIKGRKIRLADINSSNATLRGFAERLAINAPIQGSAADMIKLAMIAVHREIKKRNLRSKLILQVHDELVLDVYKSELEEVQVLVKENMESALALPYGVPVVAEWGTGANWLDAH